MTGPVLAGLLAGILLLVQALACSPRLHHWLHAESGTGNHDCAAVLLQKGFAEAPPPVTLPAPPAPFEASLPTPICPVHRAPDRELPPGRAPPHA